MEPIRVPAPPPSAFNMHRPPSDLLLSQLKYFQHLEQKHDLGVDPTLSQQVGTEAGAARYIARMTEAIRGKALAAGKGTVSATGSKPALKLVATPPDHARRRGGIALAAGAEIADGSSTSLAAKSPSQRVSKGKKP